MLEKFIDNAREDSLTAAVFSHLFHLPSEMFWKEILCRACYTKNLPDDAGEPEEILPWSSWDAKETENSDRVIPDLFIRFASFDLIIEAKRWDNDMQTPSQWQNELIAYTNKYGKGKQVRLLALGGIRSENDELLTSPVVCPVHMCRWSAVLLECQRLKKNLEEKKLDKETTPPSRTYADVRILNDLIAFFDAHGFPALQWFADFNFKSNLLSSSVDIDQQYFRNISLQFQSLL